MIIARPARTPLAALLLLAATHAAVAQAPPRVRLPAPERRIEALAFPKDFDWLNTDQPLALDKQLKGHVVVLDFWTYCCINCIHVLDDLEYLEKKFSDKPFLVVGVHSNKFETEADAANIRQAIQRYRIAHPVIVDQKHQIWNAYGIRAWPSFVVIDSEGRVAGFTQSEGQRKLLETVVEQLLEEGEKRGTLAEKPFRPKLTALAPSGQPLAFPGKVAVDAATKRLFIADSNHDRILVTDLDGKVQQVIGSGERGLKDGPLAEAQFFGPQGMAIDGQKLYVADTENHALRLVDLDAKTVTTLAGDGERSYDRSGGQRGAAQGLASPWALELHDGKLYIAMAGTHQLWVYDPATQISERFSGSGREDIVDASAERAALAQPSGLAIHDGWLYFADSEVSAIRRSTLGHALIVREVGARKIKAIREITGAGLKEAKDIADRAEAHDGVGDPVLLMGAGEAPVNDAATMLGEAGAIVETVAPGEVQTLIGTGLFHFGHRDGPFRQARLQHPLGVAVLGEKLLVADTYNSAIRIIDLHTRTIETLKPSNDYTFDEPAGLCVVDGMIYIADTNHHRVVTMDPQTRVVTPLEITLPQ